MRKIDHRCVYTSSDATDKTINSNGSIPEAKELVPGDKPNLMRPIRPKVTEGYR